MKIQPLFGMISSMAVVAREEFDGMAWKKLGVTTALVDPQAWL
jgi:hypothetical protein